MYVQTHFFKILPFLFVALEYAVKKFYDIGSSMITPPRRPPRPDQRQAEIRFEFQFYLVYAANGKADLEFISLSDLIY